MKYFALFVLFFFFYGFIQCSVYFLVRLRSSFEWHKRKSQKDKNLGWKDTCYMNDVYFVDVSTMFLPYKESYGI